MKIPMKNRSQLTHLLAITLALAALAAGAWFYTSASDPVEGIPETAEAPADGAPVSQAACEEAGGIWNECASACPPGAEVCTLNCVQTCEGLGEGESVVNVYFPNSELDPDHTDCSVVFPVWRVVRPEDSSDEPHLALEALLKFPTDAEKAEGYSTSIPEGVWYRSFTVKGGVAYVDFDAPLGTVAGSCRVLSIRAQIEETLKQFPEITSVVISVAGGDPDEALQP
jgi:hypothetical protein